MVTWPVNTQRLIQYIISEMPDIIVEPFLGKPRTLELIDILNFILQSRAEGDLTDHIVSFLYGSRLEGELEEYVDCVLHFTRHIEQSIGPMFQHVPAVTLRPLYVIGERLFLKTI